MRKKCKKYTIKVLPYVHQKPSLHFRFYLIVYLLADQQSKVFVSFLCLSPHFGIRKAIRITAYNPLPDRPHIHRSYIMKILTTTLFSQL